MVKERREKEKKDIEMECGGQERRVEGKRGKRDDMRLRIKNEGECLAKEIENKQQKRRHIQQLKTRRREKRGE